MKHFIATTCLLISLVLPLTTTTVAASGVEYKYPTNNKVLLYAPGYTTSHNGEQNEIYDNGTDYLDDATHFQSNITPKPDHEATVELVKAFGDYGTILMHTHGWFVVPEQDDFDPDVSQTLGIPCFRTGTKVFFDQNNDPSDPKYLDDLANRRLAVSKGADKKKNYQYVVFPSYIDKYVPDNSLEGSFFFLGYCASLKNDKMWKALKNKGAKVAFGYSDYVTRTHNIKMFTQLMDAEGMLPDDSTVAPKTAGEAYTNISDKTDHSHLFANFEKRVATSEWDNFIFLEKSYLKFNLKNQVVIWDISEDKLAEDVALNGEDEGFTSFPVSEASISEWLAEAEELPGDDIFKSVTPIGVPDKTCDDCDEGCGFGVTSRSGEGNLNFGTYTLNETTALCSQYRDDGSFGSTELTLMTHRSTTLCFITESEPVMYNGDLYSVSELHYIFDEAELDYTSDQDLKKIGDHSYDLLSYNDISGEWHGAYSENFSAKIPPESCYATCVRAERGFDAECFMTIAGSYSARYGYNDEANMFSHEGGGEASMFGYEKRRYQTLSQYNYEWVTLENEIEATGQFSRTVPLSSSPGVGKIYQYYLPQFIFRANLLSTDRQEAIISDMKLDFRSVEKTTEAKVALEIAELSVTDFQPNPFTLNHHSTLTSVLQGLLDDCGDECLATDLEFTALRNL